MRLDYDELCYLISMLETSARAIVSANGHTFRPDPVVSMHVVRSRELQMKLQNELDKCHVSSEPRPGVEL